MVIIASILDLLVMYEVVMDAVMVSGGALAMDGGSGKSPLQNSFLKWGNEERK